MGIPATGQSQEVTYEQRPKNGMLTLEPELADTGVIYGLIRLGTHIQENYPDSALAIFQHTLSQSRDIPDYEGIVKSLFRLGNLYAKKGWYEKGIRTIGAAIPYCYYLEQQHT